MLSKQEIHYMPQLLNGKTDKPIEWCQLLMANNKKPKGPTPLLFTLLKQHLKLYITEYRTCQLMIKDDKETESQISTSQSLYSSNSITNFSTPLLKQLHLSTKRLKLEWIIFQRSQDEFPIYGKINKKLINGNIHITHWNKLDNEESSNNNFQMIQLCKGCSKKDRRLKYSEQLCIMTASRVDAIVLSKVTTNNNIKEMQDIKIVKDNSPELCFQTIDNIQNKNLVLNLSVDNLEISLINKMLIDADTRKYAISLYLKVQQQFTDFTDPIKAYTDGSLNKINDKNVSMGAGWIIMDQNMSPLIEATGCTFNWPSSTRSELAAIFFCILCMPANSWIIIYSDSQAAIDGINKTRMNNKKSKNSSRLWFKLNNSSYIGSIIELLDSKNIRLELIKIKGHSGILGNELVDLIAKKACNCEYKIMVNNPQLKNLIYRPTWNGFTIERELRKFTKQIAEAVEQANWSYNRNLRDIFHSHHNLYNWDITWFLLRKVNQNNNITKETNSLFKLHVRLLHDSLPTLEVMKKRRYDIYRDIACLFCHQENETIEHLIECQKLQSDWDIILQETIHETLNFINMFNNKKNKNHLKSYEYLKLKQFIQNFFTDYSRDNGLHTKNQYIYESLRGFFRQSSYDHIKRLLNKSSKGALSIAERLLTSIKIAFYNRIWKSRCNKVKEWEKQNGITKMSFKKQPIKRINYESEVRLIIEGEEYDRKKRKFLNKSEQLQLALTLGRDSMVNHIKYGGKEEWIHNKHIKGEMQVKGISNSYSKDYNNDNINNRINRDYAIIASG